MQALILAAGMGKRLKELTQDNTKCMIKVNGVTLIERMLNQLENLNLSRIVIVVGYEGKKLMDFISTINIQTPVCYVNNPVYYKTNNIYSLSLAKDYLLKDDTILLESDLIFENDVLQILIDDPRETLALVDKYQSWMDGTCVKLAKDDSIEMFVPGKKFVFKDIPFYYKTVNIYKFSRSFSDTHYVPFLDAYSKALGDNEYYEQVLRVITMLDNPEIKAKKLDGQLWYEIDDIQDLDIASSMFTTNNDEKIQKIQSRYGGYWRYPNLIDFCYLVNPYFPPQKLMNEIKSSFEILITQYPSGMMVNSLLAAKNFNIHQEHIMVGNGAAELIKCLMENINGKVGFIRPTFEEYPNRYDKDQSIVFTSEKEDLSYTVEDLIDYFSDTDIGTLVLINPDNPSGNYIDKQSVIKLLDWSKSKKIKIILDESFVDFSDEENSSLIDEKIITQYKELVIIKSISKSYGVPGIRMGILVSSDEQLVAEMKRKVGIWNINSFGEFYMQIMEKYKKDYELSLSKIKATRKEFMNALSEIAAIKLINSQANYIMIEIINGITAKELTKKLFVKHNLLVKDLSGKININNRQFIRVAIRNENENNQLVEAIKKELCY